jgi:hypothetical protein
MGFGLGPASVSPASDKSIRFCPTGIQAEPAQRQFASGVTIRRSIWTERTMRDVLTVAFELTLVTFTFVLLAMLLNGYAGLF